MKFSHPNRVMRVAGTEFPYTAVLERRDGRYTTTEIANRVAQDHRSWGSLSIARAHLLQLGYVDDEKHLQINGARLVLTTTAPQAWDPPRLDEPGAGEQCTGCGEDITRALRYQPNEHGFECSSCGTRFPIFAGGYEG